VHLERLPLQVLGLEGCPTIDDKSVPALSRLKGLRTLAVRQTKITPAGFEHLKKALPKCRIESDHGTYEPK
jgi:hypothetical protein